MSAQLFIVVAMFLSLVPVTLLVPGLSELVVGAHGASESAAHAFMTVNMLAGVVAVPFAMRRLRSSPSLHRWTAGLLAVDALAFAAMGLAPSVEALLAARVLDGAVHLPAITLLMVSANRTAGRSRGGSLGALASAIMIGVAVGSPLGGWLVERGPDLVYTTGSVLLLCAAGVAWQVRQVVPAGASHLSRYQWDRRARESWVPLAYAFMDRFSIGIFVSTFTLYLTAVLGFTPIQRGLLIALFMVPFALLCYPAGKLADRVGWFLPMLIGNVLFGAVFAAYGVLPREWMPLLMLASGVTSALMFAPNLLLISDLAARGHGEGLFGAFQVAGSLGFLTGPIVGGILSAATRDASGRPAYSLIFLGVGALEIVLAVVCFAVLRDLAAAVRGARSSESSPAVEGIS